MNAKQILSFSALALIAPAFAQTVPAEEWVGPPIRAVSIASRDDVVAEYFAATRSEAPAPQELRVGPASPPAGALARAEVAAELNLWIRSGMAHLFGREGFDASAPAYQTRMAAFERMRNESTPTFVAEVQRLQPDDQ